MTAAADSNVLLREFAEHRSETAFEELVLQHLGLVYSVAIRYCGGQTALAADICQTVFIDLARKAGALPSDTMVAGWLHRHACFVAATALRTEQRRRKREESAMQLQTLADTTDWSRIAPLLDDALLALQSHDRDPLVMRFLDARSFAEVGARLGLSENTARMRVERALDKLRAKLAKRGVTSTAVALSVALSGQVITAAPSSLAPSITSVAIIAAAATPSTPGILALMASTPLKIGAAAAVAALVGSTLYLGYRDLTALREEKADLELRVGRADADLRTAQDRARRDAIELARLRPVQEELLRLRGEMTRSRRGPAPENVAAATAARAPVVEPAPASRIPKAEIHVTVPAGGSVLTGGYAPEPGKRALLLVTLETIQDPAQVIVRSKMFVAPEELFTRLGYAGHFTDGTTPPQNTMMTGDEARSWAETLAATDGVKLVGSPALSTLSGRAGSIAMSTDDQPEALTFDMVPTVLENGAVDLSMVIGSMPAPKPTTPVADPASPSGARTDGEKP